MSSFQSLYVHIPFCRSKCGYCTFFSIAGSNYILRQKYLEKIEATCRQSSNRCKPLESAFIGGGSPTYVSSDELEKLLFSLKTTLSFQSDCEFTCECNPESLTEDKLHILKKYGVNRISLGVQTFNAFHRRILKRTGNVKNLKALLNNIREHGIDNINIDLIYGIPTQTVSDWREDLKQAFDLGITHLSAYELTLEEGAVLKNSISKIDDETSLNMWLAVREIAETYGFHRYEVSNYAASGNECRHNLQIWHGATYLGLGPSASSFDGLLRWRNPSNLPLWLKNTAPEVDHISALERATEIFAFGLRTSEGWNQTAFRNKTGYNIGDLPCKPSLHKLCKQGFLYISNDNIFPTEKGLKFADHVVKAIL